MNEQKIIKNKSSVQETEIDQLTNFRLFPLIYLILIALIIRIIAVYNVGMIAKDGIKYLKIASYFSQGNFQKGLAEDFHPLYPLLIAPIYSCFAEPEHAGQLVSIVLSSLTLIPVYWLALILFNLPTAVLASILYACHPYLVRISVDVLSEPTYNFFFIAAIALGWQAFSSKKGRYYFLAAAAGSMAYLARPEGIGTIFILILWAMLADISRPKNKKRSRLRLVALTSIILAFLLVAFPYLFYLRQETGSWILTKKKSLKTLVGLSQAPKIDQE
jgi:hypothetical protein